MNLSITRISAVIFFTIFIFQIGVSQNIDKTLDQTIIFKVKEVYRLNCSANRIELDGFKNLLSSVGVADFKKIFPQKEQEKKKGNVDLSLIYQLTYLENLSVEEVITKLKKLKITEYVEPYYLPELTYTPSDTIFPSQYHLNLIRANDAWDITQGDTNIVIGITDTGWETTHPDLVPNVKINYNDPINGIDDDGDGYIDNNMGWDLGNDDNNATWESATHGVSVTGLAAAATDNVTGVAGSGFKSRFMPIKISNAAGILTHAYQGIVYAADHGCFIINCSWGSFSYSQFSKDIVDYATINKGALVVGAVGNDNLETFFYPAGYPGVLSVSNSNQSDLKSQSSNYGYYVDVSAPGEGMWTTASNGSFHTNGGTSMAAPVVSGAAALLKAQFPAYNNLQIGALLQATADDLNPNNPTYFDKLGIGRINLFNGVNATSPQFIGLTNHEATDNNNNNFLFGDTLSIETFFQNYLDPITATTVTLTSNSSFVNILDGTMSLPALGTLAGASNNSDKFRVQILNGAGINEKVVFKAVVTNGTYSNNEYFTVVLNPDYFDLAENLVSTTITSNGRIGYTDNSNTLGLGFEYDGNQLLYEAGLMIGRSSSRVSDGVRGVSGQDNDFTADQYVGTNPPFVSALDLYNNFGDYLSSNTSVNVFVKQYSYAYTGDKYVIVVYNISNVGTIPISNVHAGIFADWDIDVANSNKSGYDAALKLGYVQSLGADTIYAGIKLLSSDIANNYSLDLNGSGGVDANSSGFSPLEKFTTLTTARNAAGGASGGDVAHVVSSAGFDLDAGEEKVIAFAILAGDSLLDLQSSASAAQIRYDNDALTVVESSVENSVKIYPNPSAGVINISTKDKIENIIVRNVLGASVISTNNSQINIGDYPNGIYFVEVTTVDQKYIEKVLLIK